MTITKAELILIALREKAIHIIENYEGKNNYSKKDYYKKLNMVINKKIGSPVKAITKFSINNSLMILGSDN